MALASRATACKNDVLNVSCYEQDVIQIINAHYGRLDTTTCDHNIGTVNTECLVAGTRDVVVNRSVVDFCRVSVTQSDYFSAISFRGDHHITRSAW